MTKISSCASSWRLFVCGCLDVTHTIPVALDGLLQPAHVLVGVAHVAVGIRECRVYRDRLVVVGKRVPLFVSAESAVRRWKRRRLEQCQTNPARGLTKKLTRQARRQLSERANKRSKVSEKQSQQANPGSKASKQGQQPKLASEAEHAR